VNAFHALGLEEEAASIVEQWFAVNAKLRSYEKPQMNSNEHE
jgi:hypothetical protein